VLKPYKLTLLTLGIFFAHTLINSPSLVAAPAKDQGEEVYEGKTTAHPPAPAKKLPAVPTKTPEPSSTPAAATTSTSATSTSPTTATKSSTESTPSAAATPPSSSSSATTSSPAPATTSPSSTEDNDDEDLSVTKNQLVKGDDVPFATPKNSGVFWFVGVFLVLIVIVFVFI
jgi:cobalamin biosynthesis Mg chelatase CobN